MIRKKAIRLLGIAALIIVSGLVVLFVIFPLVFLSSAPAELVKIHNYDAIDHVVDIEIFDTDNILLYNDTFKVGADESITIEREFDWNSRGRFWFYFWEEGAYTFNISLDGIHNVSHYTELMPTINVFIQVNYDDRTPLDVD